MKKNLRILKATAAWYSRGNGMLTMAQAPAQASLASSSGATPNRGQIQLYAHHDVERRSKRWYQHTHTTRFDCVVPWITRLQMVLRMQLLCLLFPKVQLNFRAPQNLGFARGNNLAALDCASGLRAFAQPRYGNCRTRRLIASIDFARL